MTTVKRKSKQLGQILIELGLITPEQLETALEEHQKTPKALGRVLIDLGMIQEADLVRALAEQVGLEFVDLTDTQIDPASTALLPKRSPVATARSRSGSATGSSSWRCRTPPTSTRWTTSARSPVATSSRSSRPPPTSSRRSRSSPASIPTSRRSPPRPPKAPTTEEIDLEAALEDAPIVKLVNAIMTQAVAERASDVHIEPGEREVRIRFRVDGVLHEPMRPQPKNLQGGLISRLKVMADLNIAEKRVPQDGRISMKVGTRQLDLRVATLPTVHGEKVVIRVLDKSNAMLALEDLGFLEESYARFASAFSKPYGAILVTGPTGSGKSTTMYSTLNILNEESKNIITVEDPVEYRMGGVNQIQVNPKAGLTFASALRSILRADPDIVLIGEIRDKETATIAIEAALTGHLVLSSLHTNDAPSAISRLVEMDVETFLVASAIDAVVAQRLARILCEKCKEPYRPEEPELAAAGFPPSRSARSTRSSGRPTTGSRRTSARHAPARATAAGSGCTR